MTIVSGAFTLLSIGFYGALFYVLSGREQRLATAASDIPVFTRVILNIYQSYLSVFVLIAVALLALFFIKSHRGGGNYTTVFILIAFNCVFAGVLFVVSVAGMN
ncbi:MAG: hypothetical protein LJE85_13135 [Gammaproteobacteria bacterium]|jgi:predicted membrane protein|nr:hypothetical protein [Gammaproteobacteria bacterium]